MLKAGLVTPILSIAALLLLIATEPFYRAPLFNASIPIIISFQSTATPESIQFFKTVSDIGALGLIIGVLVISYLFGARNKAFYFMSYYGEIMLVMCIGKMAYHSPRPYMVSDEVQVFGCSTEFGHPSGHSINSMTFCIGLLLDYMVSNPDDSLIKKAIIFVLAIVTPLLVGFSRLYNGDHSMDQILYGWLLGLWIAFSNHYVLRDGILEHIDNLLYKKIPYTQLNFQEFFWFASLLTAAAIGSMILTFYVVDNSFEIPLDWQQRLEQKCATESIAFMSFTNASLIEGGALGLLIGAYYGILNFA